MTATDLTDAAARRRICEDLTSTLFVEAGAGTGKTRELIERILALVTSGRTELRSIAAITFTEAAAAELRDRVRIRLEDELRVGNLDAGQHDRCELALLQLDTAAIETLHAFAQRLLTDHPLEAGLPPIVEVQDETRSSIAFEEKWQDFVEALLDEPEMEDALTRAFVLLRDPKAFLASLREVAREFHENWDRLEVPAEGLAPALPKIDVSMLLAHLDRACAHMPDCRDHSDLLYIHLTDVARYRQRLAAAKSELEILTLLSERKLTQSRGSAANWFRVKPTDIRDILADAEKFGKRMVSGVLAAILPSILARLRRFILEYAEERRRQGRLEFHDLLVQARKLLRDREDVRRADRERFTHLLIDEFQDTDPLQIEIAARISSLTDAEGWIDAPIEDGRLFFVGDPKQSIYRFRRADIDLYLRARERFASGAVRLTENFRSVPSILAWVNHVFGIMMAEPSLDGQVDYVPLAPHRAAGDVSVRLLGGPKNADLATVRRTEAREIARTIQLVKEEGWQVVEDARARAAAYKDITVLMPARTTYLFLEQALEDAGIPYRVESRSLIYSTQEVRDLLSILRTIDDPTDQVAMIAALRSPAFGCGDDDLLRYYHAGGRWDYRRAAPAVLAEDDPVIAALQALNALHQRRWWETMSGIIEAVIRERRLFELAFAHRRPRERWQRLRFVLDQGRAFSEAGGRTLRQFIDWAERQDKEATRVVETVVPEQDDDAVRLMTVHAAKGQEFPIVILAGLNVQAGSQQRATPVLWDDGGRMEVHIGTDLETPGYETLRKREDEMDKSEKARLLYVAATRSRDHLIISLHHPQKGESVAKRISEICIDAKRLSRPLVPSEQMALVPQSQRPPFDDSSERRRAWLHDREEHIETLSRLPAIAATDLARRVAPDDPNVQKEPPVEEVPPWRRGRAGTAIGRAVHAVLQSIDLASGDGLEGAASAQAAAEGIPDRAREVERLVTSALRSTAVQEAVASGRYWREIYVGVPVDGTVVEGFIDLLYETPEGLVIVDYKTDSAPGDAEVEAALDRYMLQGAAYALTLERALEKDIARCVFVFTRAAGAIEREIRDLPAAQARVRELVAAQV